MGQYTSLEQSQKLVELGLNSDTADMYYREGFVGISPYQDGKYPPAFFSVKNADVLPINTPCWSVGALLNLMPNLRLMHFGDSFWCQYCEEAISDFPWHATAEYDNPIDACYELICWLLEHNYIKNN